MIIHTKNRSVECFGRYIALRSMGIRALFMFANFWLIIMAIYQLKPASRSLFIGAVGADELPYVWIGSALTMGLFIPFYNRLVARISRLHVVLGSCLAICVLLVFFRVLLIVHAGPSVSVLFYLFVDLMSVILVEQFWSLCNSIYNIYEGKRWYGLVGTGGLAGGMVGGAMAGFLIKHTFLITADLTLVAGGFIFLLFMLTWFMGICGIYCEVDGPDIGPGRRARDEGAWRILVGSPYLLLLAGILLLAQLASPLVEYQFLKTVAVSYPEQEMRTAFLSMFFSLLGFVSIVVNLGITPLVHRYAGIIPRLLVQPIVMSFFSFLFYGAPTLFFASAAKISDRGLANSINRASREQLYVPIDPVLIYQAKAWIDMFGFRVFKVAGSLLILAFTRWLPVTLSVSGFSGFIILICAVWTVLVLGLQRHYRSLAESAG